MISQSQMFCIILLIFLLPFTVTGQDFIKKQYSPTRISNSPNIDGILNDSIWAYGVWKGNFTQYEPHNGNPPSQPTEFCILYDDNYLYVGIRSFDSSPDSIVNRLTRRDNDDGDAVGIVFDSYYDLRTAFLFGVTAAGTRFDLIFSNDGDQQDNSWDPNYLARTSQNEQGWEAEFRIPFNQLRFKKNGNNIWGMQVFRNLHRNKELTFWQHTPADAPGLIHRAGELVWQDEIEPRRIFDLTPYLVTSAEVYEPQHGNPFASGKDQNYKLGLDAKLGITNNFTLDMTINPDFGQVEADPSEVNLTAFETFFQEKRPFFIEGRNISSFSLGIGDGDLGNDNLFYSRRIGRRPQGYFDAEDNQSINRPAFTNILGAAKLTGKTQDGLSLAILNTVTSEVSAEIDTEGERSSKPIEPLSNYFISRVQKDFNEGNTLLGGMVTGAIRNADENLSQQMHRQAYTGGLDFTKFFRQKSWMFNINAAMSHVAGDELSILRTQRAPARYFQRPDANHVKLDSTLTSLTGTGGRMQIGKIGSGHLNMLAAVLWKSPQFEINDIGFMREADQIFQVFWAGYRVWEPKKFYRSYNLNFNQYNAWTFGGERAFSGWNVNGFIRWRNYWSSNLGLEFNHNWVSTSLLRGGPSFSYPNRLVSWFGAGTDSRKNFILSLNGNWGLGFENNLNYIRLSPVITYKAADNLSLSFNPSYLNRYDELQYITNLNYDGDEKYIFSSLDQQVLNFSFRINYTITPDLSIQYWGQPFVACGNYYDYKYITDPRAASYRNRFQPYTSEQIWLADGTFSIDENLDGIIDYEFNKSDFNVREFLSNLVIRWEFNPGSSLFLVWSQTRSAFEANGELQYFNDLGQMFSKVPHNIFLLKISYRIGIH